MTKANYSKILMTELWILCMPFSLLQLHLYMTFQSENISWSWVNTKWNTWRKKCDARTDTHTDGCTDGWTNRRTKGL